MIRGTTPTHTFVLPFDTKDLTNVVVIYAQGDKEVLRKTVSDCEMEENTISLSLTQEETLEFDCKKAVQIQIKVLTGGGNALVSDIIWVDVGKCLNNEVLA